MSVTKKTTGDYLIQPRITTNALLPANLSSGTVRLMATGLAANNIITLQKTYVTI